MASHSLTVPSAEQERRRWCALLYTKPQTESVCPNNVPRRIDGSVSENTRRPKSVPVTPLEKSSDSKRNDAVTVGVVGVDVGIGGVPALYGPVYPAAETLLP